MCYTNIRAMALRHGHVRCSQITSLAPADFYSVMIYMIGKTKQYGGKIVVPLLVFIHGFFFVFVAMYLVGTTRLGSSSFDTEYIGPMLIIISLTWMPFVILPQVFAQYWALRKMPNYGALCPRSICLQAIVMAVMAIRLLFKFGVNMPDISGQEDTGFFQRVSSILQLWYGRDFIANNYLLWIAGAGIVYLRTRSSKSKTSETGKEVELEVLLA